MPLKPVIFLPGFPASKLRDRNTLATVFPPSIPTLLNPAKKQAFLAEVLNVPGNLIAGPPISSLIGGIVNEAQSLYAILTQFGYDISELPNEFAPIGWDWRQGIGAAAVQNAIRTTLDRLSPQKDGNVVAIVHSTGGLLLRAFLETFPNYLGCFEQVFAFGVPWCGTLESLHAATVGESEGFLFIKLITQQEAANMVNHTQAVYDLMPSDPATNLFIGANGQPTTPLADQSWISQQYMKNLAASAHPAFPQQFDGLRVTNVCGWGSKTWPACTVDANGKLHFLPQEKYAGDGTIPLVSSSWLRGNRVRTMFLPIGAYATGAIPKPHSQLWDSPPVLQLFREVLLNVPPAPFIAVAADSDDYIDYGNPVMLRMTAMRGDGSPLPNCIATLNTPGHPAINFTARTRADYSLSRIGIQHNVGSDIYRFEVRFDWTGGTMTYPVAIHSV